jgi:hypothetical protein
LKNYKVIWKPYHASKLTAQEPKEFEEEINKLAKEGWEVKSSSAVAIKIAAVDWIMLYALMKKEQ